MQYDPIKRSLGNVFNKSPFLRVTFYKLLDLLLLRAWHIHKELRSWASNKKGQEAHIFDAGAGFGQYTHHLSEMDSNWKILAADVKEEQVEDCNLFFKEIGKDNQVRFEVQNLVTYKKPGAYDLVVCVDVMEHIEEDVQVMTNYCESLKEGGMLLISTPSDQGGSDVHEETGESFIDEHVRDGYNLEEIQDKLHDAGFSRVDARYSYGSPGKISWKLSMKFPLTILNWSKAFFVIIPFYFLLTYPFSFLLNMMDVNGKHPTGTGLIVKAWK